MFRGTASCATSFTRSPQFHYDVLDGKSADVPLMTCATADEADMVVGGSHTDQKVLGNGFPWLSQVTYAKQKVIVRDYKVTLCAFRKFGQYALAEWLPGLLYGKGRSQHYMYVPKYVMTSSWQPFSKHGLFPGRHSMIVSARVATRMKRYSVRAAAPEKDAVNSKATLLF